jgi:hypothetical protein
MRRHVVLLAVFLLAAAAGPASASMKFLNQTAIRMKVVASDGTHVADKVVSYSILRVNGQWEAYWDEVTFMDIDGEVVPALTHFSTKEGSIANVKVGSDHASFDIETGVTSVRVVCRPPSDFMGMTVDVRAMAIFPDRTEEWLLTDKIILPSKVIGTFSNQADRPKQ